MEQRIRQLQRVERRKVLSQIEVLASEAGMKPEEVAAHFVKAKKTRKPGTPKYRNPAGPPQTWTGKGRKPGWLGALLKKGKKPESLAIKN